jgi:site-specific recombinase XerD
MINRHLKTIKTKYNIKVEHLNGHSFRKAFGRKVVDSDSEQSKMELIKLNEIFNHASPMITSRYLGLRSEELQEVYNTLSI